MNINKSAQQESTLLCVIAQAHACGATIKDVDYYIQKLTMDSSRELVNELYSTNPFRNSTLERWAKSL